MNSPYRKTFRYTRRVGDVETTYELDVYEQSPIMPSKETEIWQRLEARAMGAPDEPADTWCQRWYDEAEELLKPYD